MPTFDARARELRNDLTAIQSRLQGGESSRVVDNVVGNQDFLPPSALKVFSRGVVEPPKKCYARKEEDIFAVPEAVLGWSIIDDH